jgi:hypothetical protein
MLSSAAFLTGGVFRAVVSRRLRLVFSHGLGEASAVPTSST